MNLLPGLKASGLMMPRFVADQTQYLTIMGSEAYGVSSAESDRDIYGFTIPPKEYIFPHLRGEIPDFSTPGPRFNHWSTQNVEHAGKSLDFQVYNITTYFRLCMENNPNMLDSLFTPDRCVMHVTPVGQMVRDGRHLFLSKRVWAKMRGYSYSQLSKMDQPRTQSKRADSIKEHGFDIKFAYHVVRLLLECRMILQEGTLVLDANREVLKSIRRGEWTSERVHQYFTDNEAQLQALHDSSSLPDRPDEAKIKELLLNCLEQYYGSLTGAVRSNDI